MILFVMLSASALFAFLSSSHVLNRYYSAFFSICSVVSVSVLNGIRDLSIGTDLGVYGNNVFIQARANMLSFHDYMFECKAIGMTEYGYAIFNYIIAQFSSNIHIFYFLLGIFVNSIFYISGFRNRERIPFSIAWITYLMIIYPATLNLLRQGVALALISLMGSFLLSNKNISALLCILAACSFHNSAVFAFIIYIFIYLICRVNAAHRQNMIVLVFLCVSAFVPTVVSWLDSKGLLSDKYSQYVVDTSLSISLISSLIARIPFFVLSAYYLIKERSDSNKIDKSLFGIVGAELLLLPLQNISSSAFRVALYYGVYKIPGYPLLCKKFRGMSKIAYIIYVIYLMSYFYIQTIRNGSGEIYPFVVAADTL
ncbi:brp/Blh family beta-carotene 15,15'-monooxygenase [Bifidobacterium criceti]|uniref:Brp/Blh family beta-carotene 15,15'-monooxygenase n=2 Tax=Bifidobacterium criceti TaxID=1960969 RepID=A0A2A2EJ74_9BIFI|nr:brp/Blh family beta-carotene 15,15'-monooxygenase [Bifidobacterium criceti]